MFLTGAFSLCNLNIEDSDWSCNCLSKLIKLQFSKRKKAAKIDDGKPTVSLKILFQTVIYRLFPWNQFSFL